MEQANIFDIALNSPFSGNIMDNALGYMSLLTVSVGVCVYHGRVFKKAISNIVDGALASKVIEAVDGRMDYEDQLADEQEMARNLLGDANAVQVHPRGEDLTRFAAVLAADVKLKLGSVPKATEANRLVAWDLLNKACVARDVRKAYRLRFCQVAIDMVFIPDSMDVQMAKVRKSGAVRRRLADVSANVSLWQKVVNTLWQNGPSLAYRSG